jgi:hypothetical protein
MSLLPNVWNSNKFAAGNSTIGVMLICIAPLCNLSF